jgi:FkbM family methyltransferase
MNTYDFSNNHYFDLDLLTCNPDEVLVDIGAFAGDTVIDYINTYTMNYKKIYCYEIHENTFNHLLNNLKDIPNIEFRRKGAGEKNGIMYLSDNTYDSSHRLLENGKNEVETVTIDDDITEPVTFIKMDIEGGELNALKGCINHIRNHKPKLAISVYHGYDDLWIIPRYIDEICPGYTFNLRYYGYNGQFGICGADGHIFMPVEFALIAVYKGNP